MESPVVVDKPPEYHGSNDRGFPFDEEESGAWSSLAARHPDIAARLRQRPASATWARKRRPSGTAGQPPHADFGDEFDGFDRFPFDDIPPEFREHFPSHFNRRYSREEPAPASPRPSQPPAPPSPQPPATVTAGTQTDHPPAPAHQQIPQYGLRNTVDLGQKSAVDVDADERGQRSMSAPPDSRPPSSTAPNMSQQEGGEHGHSNVRHIPIFVEGRDEPVINRSADPSAHFADPKPTYAPPPQPHINREQYFAEDEPVGFHHAPNFSRAFGTPFGKGYRQGPQPFVQQKVYPQTAFTRGASPQRSQSPKPQQEEFVKVPRQPPPPPQRQQYQQSAPHPQQPHPHPTQQHQQPQQPQTPQQQEQPKPKPQPAAHDPITQILSIQTDVLNLMSEVENFTGTKKDKRYIYLDEMLTRNLIKLDNIETEGKENIRQARKEAIRCIEKCIAVLEAKADKGNQPKADTNPPQDVEMNEKSEQNPEEYTTEQTQETTSNGEVEMKDATKEETKTKNQEQTQTEPPKTEIEMKEQPKTEDQSKQDAPETNAQPTPDTRPENKEKSPQPEQKDDKTPKKSGKNVKKRDKSASKDKDSNKDENAKVDGKGDAMEVDGAASQ